MMAEIPVLDRHIVSNLLSPASKTVVETEEQLHPWCADSLTSTFEMPFLRTWDHYSGSQPVGKDLKQFMTSRAPRERLDTIESRRSSLTKHLNHTTRTPTPYISFTTSATAVQELANMREFKDRGVQTLAVVDPNTRLRHGLPILDVATEMDHYDIQDPYRRSKRYYIYHYVCLWQVTDREIIGQWKWKDLIVNENWYQDIIMPAFRDFTRKSTTRSLESGQSDLLAGMNKLSRR
jgi:hypothetical protein